MAVMQIRIDDDLKNNAAAVFDKLGIDIPTAVRIFMKRAVLENGIPFKMTLPRDQIVSCRAVRAMEQLSEEAEKIGTANMTLAEINAEIDEMRRAKHDVQEGV